MLCRREQLLSQIKGHRTYCKFRKLLADLIKFKHSNFSLRYDRGQINLSPANINKLASTFSISPVKNRENRRLRPAAISR
jgi:hypothetical protein